MAWLIPASYYGKHHQIKGIKPGGINFTDDMLENPYKFAQDIAPTIMKAAGGDKEKMILILSGLLQNRTAADIIHQRDPAGQRVSGRG